MYDTDKTEKTLLGTAYHHIDNGGVFVKLNRVDRWDGDLGALNLEFCGSYFGYPTLNACLELGNRNDPEMADFLMEIAAMLTKEGKRLKLLKNDLT